MSALAAAFIIYHNGKLARLRATIDLIMHQKSDVELMRCVKRVYALSDTVQFSRVDAASDDGMCILRVLNNQEFIAGGIRQGAFSESVYKQMQCSNVRKVYKASAGMIAEIRHKEKLDTLFQDFEWLAKRWDNDPLKKN